MSAAVHGYGRYTNGCRCEVCREAKAAYMRQRRAAARARAAALTDRLPPGPRHRWPAGTSRHYVPDVKHGTSYAYYERGCRCLDCTKWESGETAKRLRRRRGAA